MLILSLYLLFFIFIFHLILLFYLKTFFFNCFLNFLSQFQIKLMILNLIKEKLLISFKILNFSSFNIIINLLIFDLIFQIIFSIRFFNLLLTITINRIFEFTILLNNLKIGIFRLIIIKILINLNIIILFTNIYWLFLNTLIRIIINIIFALSENGLLIIIFRCYS